MEGGTRWRVGVIGEYLIVALLIGIALVPILVARLTTPRWKGSPQLSGLEDEARRMASHRRTYVSMERYAMDAWERKFNPTVAPPRHLPQR
jgi:uncharacterized membrane-anchored protein YhcB (DUF1043 family)